VILKNGSQGRVARIEPIHPPAQPAGSPPQPAGSPAQPAGNIAVPPAESQTIPVSAEPPDSNGGEGGGGEAGIDQPPQPHTTRRPIER
jgi:hypothetical protein